MHEFKKSFFTGSSANSNVIGLTKNFEGWYECNDDMVMETGIYRVGRKLRTKKLLGV